MMSKYRDLIVWQKAIALVIAAYKVSASFPRAEQFGLTTQFRRAAVSVPSNIAEGQGRLTPGDCLRFLGNARGSLLELETQAIIASKLAYLSDTSRDELLLESSEVGKLLNALIQSLQSRRDSL